MSHWKQARWPFVVFVLIEVVIFGSGSAVTKFAYDSITPLWCLAVRFGLATAVFALFHPGAFACGPVAALQIVAASVLLTLVRLFSGGLATPIAMHAAWNAIGGIGFGVVSLADDYPNVFATSLSGPELISGGTMGIEGSVVVLAVTCALCIAVFAIHCRLRSNSEGK